MTRNRNTWLAALGSLLATASAQTITAVNANRGSLEGGTYVTIWGDGFNRNGQDGSTRIFFGTDQAEFVEYDSSDVKLVAYSPPGRGFDETVTVRVGLLSVSGKSAYAACPSASACQFNYRGDATPSIEFMSLGGASGQTLSFYGRLLGTDTEAYSITIGDINCEVDENLYSDPNAILPSSTRTGVVRCIAGAPLEAGRYNVTVRVRDAAQGYGQASIPLRARGVEVGTGRPYSFTAHPQVAGLSYTATGLGGGSELVLAGSGFSWESPANDVSLGGVPCRVTSAMPSELRCIPGAVAAPSMTNASTGVLFPGGRGLWHRVWNNVVVPVETPVTSTPSRAFINTGSLQSASFNEIESFTEEMSGFFIPPVTATYSFLVRADDYAAVFLSTDATPANRVMIASASVWFPTWAHTPQQVSAPLALIGGQRYFFSVRHTDSGSGDYLDVGLRVHLEGNAAATAMFGNEAHRQLRSVPEHQRIEITTDVVREMQSFTVAGAASGSFTLAVGSSMRTDNQGAPVRLAWNARDSDVANYVNNIIGCGSIGVTREAVVLPGNVTGFSWNVTVNCPLDGSNWPTIVPYSVSLAPRPGAEVVLTSGMVRRASRPAGGSFRLAFNGTVGDYVIPARAGGWQIRAAILELLPAGASVEVQESYTEVRDGGSWNIAFLAPYGNLPLLRVVTTGATGNASSTLTGSGVTAVVTETLAGSTDALLWPVPMDYFQTAVTTPNAVVVTTNGIVGSCTANCSFVYDAARTPTITGVTGPATVTAGDVLTITGTNFLDGTNGVGMGPGGINVAPALLNTVYLGGAVGCNVTEAMATMLSCVVLNVPAGTYPLRVIVDGDKRGAAVPGGAFTAAPLVTYRAVVRGFAPSAGSVAGGTLLVITGTGFFPSPWEANNSVTVGGAPCPVTEASVTRIVCSPSAAAAGSAPVVVNGVSASGTFTFDASLTAQVADMTPRVLSGAITGTVSLSLSNLAGLGAVALNASAYSITFGARACRVINITAGGAAGTASVNCVLIRGAPAALPQVAIAPRVVIGSFGAAATGSVSLDASYRVDSLSSASGSLAGGTEVVITGAGFSPRLFQNEVSFVYQDQFLYDWDVPANVTAVSPDGTAITVVVPAVPLWKRGRANSTTPQAGSLKVRVNNVTAPCALVTNSCGFTQSMAYTPLVTAANVSADLGTLTVYGSLLGRAGASTRVTVGPFGPFDCTGAVPFDSVVCALPTLIAGTHDVSVSVTGWGTGRSSTSVIIPLVVNGWPSFAPTRGSTEGGTVVTFAGTGFADDDVTRNIVRFGTATAVILTASRTSLTLYSPPFAASASPVNVLVVVRAPDLLSNAGLVTLPGAFTYDSALAATPILTSVTPRSGYAGDVLVLRGSGFGGNTTDAAMVTIGGVHCAVGAINASFISCTLGATPAGTHRVMLFVTGKGLARSSPGPSVRFTSLLEVSAQTGGASVGLGGGALVTLTGRGFPNSVDDVVVGACNTRCTVLASNYTSLTCAAAPMVTVGALQALRVWAPAPLTPASVSVPAAMDGAVDASFSGSSSCTIDADLGATVLGVVTSVRLYPRFRRTASLQGARFLGRADASSEWTLLARVSTSYVQEGWNEWNVEGYEPANNAASVDWTALPAVRFLRFAFATGVTDCTGNEIEFRGIPVSPATACPVNVTVSPGMGALAPLTGAVVATAGGSPSATLSYSLGATPVITGVTPDFGTALGGDIVTLTGSGFPSSPAGVTVSLNGMPCDVQSSSPTSLSCRTTPRAEIMPISINVTVVGVGAALYDATRVYFRYLDRWSAPTTWKYNEPPLEGDSVVVPEGQAILVDVSPPRLNLVLVQGDLVFDRRDMSFDAHYIFVHGGRFEVGTEARPFTNKLTITLHGDRRESVEIPEVGTKMLTVMSRHGSHMGGMAMGSGSNGQQANGAPQMASPRGYSQGFLELHGAPRKRVWTRLGAAIPAGASIVTTAEDVDWTEGETLIVTNTFDYGLTEEVTVAEVLGPRSLRLTRPLSNPHDCKSVPAGEWGFADVALCAEVALLSRNVVIRGDPHKSPRQLFGVHTGAMHGGVYHVENVELTHCGQQGLLGRYCSHFHMTADNWNSYVRFNSIHHSFQRAVTIHATNYATVKHNVAYDVFGHTIFVEDGVEQHNVIEENLVVHSKPCGMCIASDKKPANFWTASPTNLWRHNVAGGSTHFGFWFELPGNPHGPSFTPSYCPVNMPLGEFFNNTAHSSSIGLRVYPQFFPRTDGCASNGGTTLPAYFTNSTFFHNGQGMFHRNVGDLHHVNARYVENFGEDISWRKYLDVEFDWDPNVRDSLFMCSTNPNARSCGTRAITAPQTEFWYAANLTLVNYRTVGALSGCHSCMSDENLAQGGYTYRFAGLRWVNTSVRVHWNEPRKCIMWDIDGSLTGFPNGMTTPYYAFNNHPGDGCTRDTTWTFKNGTVCDGRHPIRRLQVDAVDPVGSFQWQNINITTSAGWDRVQYRPKEIAGWTAPVVVNRGVNITWLGTLSDWQKVRLRYSEPEYVTSDSEFMLAGLSWVDYRWRVSARYGSGLSDPEIPSLPPGAASDPTSDVFGVGTHPNGTAFNATTGQRGAWSVTIANRNATRADRSKLTFTAYAIQCPPWGCPMPPTPSISTAVYWSDPSVWPGGVLPREGADVTINSTTYVIMDVNPPRLGKLTIEGRLEFADSGPRRLEAALIVNWGNFTIGTPSDPFLNRAEVVLHGVRTSPVAVVDNNLFLGNKVLANLGTLSWVGRPLATTWTFLNATVLPGATRLVLARSVEGDWLVGQKVVITPTQYDYTTVETAEIESVSGNIVTLSAPLLRRHYAGPAAANGTGAGILLRAAVGLLSRNIVFRGNVSGPADTYGGHIFTSSVRRGGVTRAGSVDIRYVELRNLGKGLMEYPALHFQYGAFQFDPSIPASNPRNYLEGVAFNEGFNHAIEARAARGVTLNGSVVYRTYRNGLHVDADSPGFGLLNTLLVSNLRAPNAMAADQTPWVVPQAAVYMEAVPGRMTGNVVGGAFDAGFTFRVPTCRAANASGVAIVSSNEAHAARIGAFLLPSRGGCVGVEGLRVWKAAHAGVLTVDQVSSVTLRRLVVSDSHIGVSLNFLRPGLVREEGFSRIEDSTIIGTSPATDGCEEDTTCRAATAEDVRGESCGSVLGASVRRAGLMLPQVVNKGKTCEVDADGFDVCTPVNTPTRLCSMPWEKRYGTAGSAHAGQYLTNVRFVGFGGSECAAGLKSKAVVWNPSQVDLSVPSYARGVVWEATPEAARFDVTPNGVTHAECRDGMGCDATNFLHFRDEDGSLLGSGAGATLLGPNPQLARSSPTCLEKAAWPGIVCAPSLAYRSASISSVERDAGHLNLGALQITRLDAGVTDFDDNATWGPRTTLSRGSLKESCSMADFWPQYPHMITPGSTTHLYWPATEPGGIQYQLFSRDASDALVVALAIQRPYVWEMYVQDCAACPSVQVPMMEPANRSDTTIPALTDAPGTWLFNPQKRRIWFTVRGGAPTRTYRLVRTPAIQVTMHLAISVETFFGPDLVSNLALLLGIAPGTIRIVDVRPGSTVVEMQIRDEEPTVLLNETADPEAALAAANSSSPSATGGVNSTQAWDAQFARVGRLAQRLEGMKAAGQLASIGGIPVLALEVVAPPEAIAAVGGSLTPAAAPSPNKDPGLTAGAAGGIAAGVVAAVMLLAGLAVLALKRRREASSSPIVPAKDSANGADSGASGEDVTAIAIGGGGHFIGVNPGWSRQQATAAAAAPAPTVRAPSARVLYVPTLSGSKKTSHPPQATV